MAAHPIVVVDHGRVEIPAELQSDPLFRDGARLQLVPMPEPNPAPADRSADWDRFMQLAGILKDSAYDPNYELELEKQRELEAEAR